MRIQSLCVLAGITGAALVAGCQSGAPRAAQSAPIEPRLYDGMDRYHREIDTESPEAQAWFDQGLVLAYGFNHAEAIRSFEEAARLDPESPMPWWGMAYARGMNINDPVMTEERYRLASIAVQEAEARLNEDTPSVERALVEAVAKRYSWPPPAEQRDLDERYAHAMGTLWQRFRADPDIGVLYAEALMNLQPWDYWTNDGAPKGRIEEVTRTLEAVLLMDMDHPGATHFYIHAVEASPNPERAVTAAGLLERRVPGSGHLTHMPSHIWVRVGRYPDAADANVRAVAADRAYFSLAPEADLYYIYYAHNLHFLAYASMMEGRYETAIRAARDLEREIPESVIREYAGLIEGIMPTTYHVMIRFGRWEEILEEPQRPEYRLVTRAVHHYARGVALSALGRTDEAREEMAEFESAAAGVPGAWMIFNNRVDQVLPIARAMLEGELAFREGRYEEAFAALRRGIDAEDALVYDEPPGWMLPVRHPYGAFLMSAGRYAEAEAVYREDQRRVRNNGWSLLGLQQALEAQGREAEAEALGPALAAAWPRPDVTATSSCLCEPRPQWVVVPTP